jgi:alpha-glucuronidase
VDAQTFGLDPQVGKTVGGPALTSWRTFENYTGPLGLQTLTDIVGNHYGVLSKASEENGWGQWHPRRQGGSRHGPSVATGHRLRRPVSAAVAQMYEPVDKTPDDLARVHAPRPRTRSR